MGFVFQQGCFPNFQRDQARAALASAVLTANFHLEDFVGVPPSLDPGVSQESDEAAATVKSSRKRGQALV